MQCVIRSSIGTLHSSRSSSASRPRSRSPGNESWKSRSHHSSMSSLHSEDSGRSGSPYQGPPAPRSRRASSTTRLGIKPVTQPGITVLSPGMDVDYYISLFKNNRDMDRHTVFVILFCKIMRKCVMHTGKTITRLFFLLQFFLQRT